MNECFASTQNIRKHLGGFLEHGFRSCYRYMKNTKPPPLPIDLNLCPASWVKSQLEYVYGLHIPQPLPLPIHISQASGMAYMYIYRNVNLYN